MSLSTRDIGKRRTGMVFLSSYRFLFDLTTLPLESSSEPESSDSESSSSSVSEFSDSDSDDSVTPEYLESLLDKARKNAAAVVATQDVPDENKDREEEVIVLGGESRQRCVSIRTHHPALLH